MALPLREVAAAPAPRPAPGLRALLRQVRESDRPTVLFLNRFPEGDDLKDGYYQRVQSIDDLLSGATRIYVHHERSFRGLLPIVREVAEGAFDVRCRTSSPVHLALLALLARACTVVWSHSAYGVSKRRRWWLFLLGRRRYLDLHGAVPEEITLMQKRGARRMAAVEARAVARADVLIAVTGALAEHVRAKHALRPDEKEVILLPIHPKASPRASAPRHSRHVIYSGGLQAWQQVDKMLAYVHARRRECTFTFLVPDPDELRRRYAALHGEPFPGEVESATPEEVRRRYGRSAFGLVLREDVVVNRVACPTKLVEYLQHDVVPIVDSANMGDFQALGLRAVGLTQPLPPEHEWGEMVAANRRVLLALEDSFRAGGAELGRALTSAADGGRLSRG